MIYPKGKKGFTSIFIASVILAIFFFTAVFIPTINADLNANIDTFDTDNLDQQIKNNADSISILNIGTLLINVLKLGLWDVGNSLGLPFWADAFYTFLAVILFVIVLLWIRGVG